MIKERNINTMDVLGGWLCLDFTNTVGSRREEPMFDYLTGYEAILIWSSRLSTLEEDQIKELREIAAQNSKQAQISFLNIQSAREALFQFFQAMSFHKIPTNKIQSQFNFFIHQSFKHLALTFSVEGTAKWDWKKSAKPLDLPLYPIMHSAYQLVNSDLMARLKECHCGWLFLDRSKNQSRRWCDMQTCGSAHKARRYYRKKKRNTAG